MSKKDKKKQFKEITIENYYDLKQESIDDLVAALREGEDSKDKEESKPPLTTNIAEITGEEQTAKAGSKKAEFDPYRRDKLAFLPVWLKAIFIKWWFAGAVCFFIMWGIGLQDEDAILLVGIVLGIVVDVLVNPIFRMMESDRKEYNAYIMFPFPFKKYWTFFTNIIYYVAVVFVVNFGYLGVNQLVNLIKQTSGIYYVGVEPLLFGTFSLAADMAFIGIKDLIVFLVKRNKKKKEEEIADV